MSQIDPFAAPTMNAFESRGQSIYPEGYNRPIRNFDIHRLLTAPLSSPNWLMNVLWMLGCLLLSSIVVGSLVGFGYIAEVAESRCGGKGKNWPDFDLNKFSDYLLRGLWPFLWNLIWTIPLLLGLLLPLGITSGLANILANNQQGTSAIIVGVTGASITIFILLAGGLAMFASMMHSALGNDFIKGGDLRWIASYVSKMGLTTVIAGLVFTIVGMLMGIAGMIALCVGYFVAAGYIYLMYADLMAQLHDIFVSRGGTPAFGNADFSEEIVDAQILN